MYTTRLWQHLYTHNLALQKSLVQLIQAPGNDSGQRRVVAIPNGINHVVKTDVKLWHGSRNLLIELS